MKNILLIFIILSFLPINLSFADVEQRRAELIRILDEELKEVTRLNKQTNGARPDLMLRMAQVLLEKGRLLKDLENQKYLEIPPTERAKVNKDEHFKESRRYFDQAQKTVLVLFKKFKKFDEKADAYYVLAYNAKELKQDEQSKKYFQKVLEESRGDTLVADKSKISLAEMYFNSGSYDKSLSYYESSLKTKRDKWWTKDAFNLAWCYYKVGKTDKAISTMNEIYDLSKNPKYIDMSRSIERDIALFYTEAGRPQEAVAFYKRNGKSVSEVMLKVGRYLKLQGKFSSAEKTLNEGLQHKQNEKEEIDINVELLSLYEKFGRDDRHLEACRVLAKYFDKGLLNAEQTESLRFNAQKMSALLQQQIVNKTYQHIPETQAKKANAAQEYFMIEAKLDPEKAQLSYFHAGETLFSMGKYDQAVPMYAESIKLSQKNNDKKTEGLAGTSLLVSLGKNVTKETATKYMIPAYEGYLAANPKSEKANAVYQRLFSAQMEKKNLPDAEKTLMNYKAAFPAENETQEKMLAQVMDHYKSQGDKASLYAWAKKIDAQEFKVSPEYAKKVKALMMGMQFENVEQANSKGDKRGALAGYIQIYKAPDSDNEAKKMAAYNIAVLSYENGDYQEMYNWADRASTLMTADEVVKFEKDYILFSTDLFQRRQFEMSSKLSEKNFDKICSTKSQNKRVFFKNANVIYLAEKQFDKSKNLLAKGSKCGISSDVIWSGQLDHLNELASSNKWGSYSEVIKALEESKTSWASLIYPSSLLANELESMGRIDDAKKVRAKMLAYYDASKKQKAELPLEALDAISYVRLAAVEDKLKNFNAMKLQFPEAEYNKMLKTKFSKLDQLTSEAIAIAEMGSGVGIVRAYRLVVTAHESLHDEIIAFTPPGKSEEYVTSFKASMKKVADPIGAQAKDFRVTAIGKIEKENILSPDNTWFLIKNEFGFIPEYFSERGASLIEVEGDKTVNISSKCQDSKFDEAFKEADEVYLKNKNNAFYWNQIGICYYLKSDFSKAILFYNKARDLDSKLDAPVNNLGVVYQKQGRSQKALAAFKKASEMNTFSQQSVYNMAQLYLHFGALGKALPTYEALLKKFPQDVEFNSAMASAHLQRGDFNNALSIYSYTLPKDIFTAPQFGLNYAVALKFAGKKDEALAVLAKVGPSVGDLKEYAQKVENFIRN
jgi:tetratricopeptide (TPR) repeat protein